MFLSTSHKKEHCVILVPCEHEGVLPAVRCMSCPLLWYFKNLIILFSTQDDPIGNINLAMEIAEKHLDIPKMLDAEGEMKIGLTELQGGRKAKPIDCKSCGCGGELCKTIATLHLKYLGIRQSSAPQPEY